MLEKPPRHKVKHQELEVKFLVQDLTAVEKVLNTIGASLSRPRILEQNLRFDNPEGDLTRKDEILRLRISDDVRLTHKGASNTNQGISVRDEIELVVSDFDKTWGLLDALGYQVQSVYEKYRTAYQYENIEILLDEMPFGNFVEIEGPGPKQIRAVAIKLGLNWEHRTSNSYMAIYQHLCTHFPCDPNRLTFDVISTMNIDTSLLALKYADAIKRNH